MSTHSSPDKVSVVMAGILHRHRMVANYEETHYGETQQFTPKLKNLITIQCTGVEINIRVPNIKVYVTGW